MTAVLEGRLKSLRGGFGLDVDLSAAGGTTVLFGASGSGKTTLLRAVAGLDRVEGHLRVGDEVWLDTAAGVDRPPHLRPVGFVFQDANLLPHLSVRGNLVYGMRRAGGAGPVWDDVVAWTGLDPLLDRSVEALSGGERQRVALGRALLRAPRLLLMDEPLSAVDEPTRRTLLPLLGRLQERYRIPMLYVTHALDEAVRLADRMIWLDAGRVRSEGPLADVLAAPDFVLWRGDDAGVVAEARVAAHDPGDHLSRLDGPWGPMLVRLLDLPADSSVRVRVLARDVSLARTMEEDSTLLNQFLLRVDALEDTAPGETTVRLRPRGGGPVLLARVTTRSARRLALAPGREVYARVKAVAVLA